MAIEVVEGVISSALSNTEARRITSAQSFDGTMDTQRLSLSYRGNEITLEHPNTNTYGANPAVFDPNTYALIGQLIGSKD